MRSIRSVPRAVRRSRRRRRRAGRHRRGARLPASTRSSSTAWSSAASTKTRSCRWSNTSAARGHVLRFIEYMDVGTCNGWSRERVVPSRELRDRIARALAIAAAGRRTTAAKSPRAMPSSTAAAKSASSVRSARRSAAIATARALSADGQLYHLPVRRRRPATCAPRLRNGEDALARSGRRRCGRGAATATANCAAARARRASMSKCIWSEAEWRSRMQQADPCRRRRPAGDGRRVGESRPRRARRMRRMPGALSGRGGRATARRRTADAPRARIVDTAIIAGTMAVKRTHELIPFCHPLPIDGCRIR